MPIGTANASNPRIDRVIIRLDWTANTIQLAVLRGTPATSPTAPALTQNSSRWEISLAQILVGANVSTIVAGNVTDERNYVKNANVDEEDWMNLTLQNSWVSFGAPYFTPSFRKNNFDEVELKGSVKSGVVTGGTPIATLPAGYRPPNDRTYSVICNNGTSDIVGRITLKANGEYA